MTFELFILYLVDGLKLILEFKSFFVLFSVYIPNYVVNFTMITELLKWIYRIAYETFWTAYT
jgi:hypothetical protein